MLRTRNELLGHGLCQHMSSLCVSMSALSNVIKFINFLRSQVHFIFVSLLFLSHFNSMQACYLLFLPSCFRYTLVLFLLVFLKSADPGCWWATFFNVVQSITLILKRFLLNISSGLLGLMYYVSVYIYSYVIFIVMSIFLFFLVIFLVLKSNLFVYKQRKHYMPYLIWLSFKDTFAR